MNKIIMACLCLSAILSVNLPGDEAFGEAPNIIEDESKLFDRGDLITPAPSSGTLPSAIDIEAELFGDSSVDEKGLEAESDLIAHMDAYLSETDNTLDIGGQIFFRLESYLYENTAPKKQPLTAPCFVDINFDIRPHDHLRVFTQGRLNHDFTSKENTVNLLGQTGEPTSGDLDQFWIKFDLSRSIYLTLGRQRIKWGSGRFWNPTDFLNQQPRDPLDVFDKRLGVSLLKAHLPFEKKGWNIYGIIDLEEASSLDEIGGAFRAEILIKQAEISLSAALRKNQPQRLGFDISFGLWEFDIRGEVAVLHNVEPPFGQAPAPEELQPFLSNLQAAYDRKNDWIPQAVVGTEISIKYSAQDSLLLGAEYFYNDAGYNDPDLYPWLLLQGGFIPFYLGQHYASTYLLLMNPGCWNNTVFTLSALANLSDHTYLTRLDYQAKVLTYLNLNIFTACHFGQNGEFHLAFFDLLPPELLPENFQNDLAFSAIQFEFGLGLNLKF